MARITKTGTSDNIPDFRSSAGQAVDRNIRFRKLIENSHDGITLLDKDFNIIYRSSSAERIVGWKTADRIKKNVTDLIHSEEQQQVKRDLNEIILKGLGQSKTCIFRSKHFDGHYIWLEGIFTNFLNDPDINAIVCNFRDISQKRKDDDLLQQTINELFAYRYALDESAIVAITDQKGIIKHINDNFCKISQYRKEELIGQDHRIINSSYHDKTFIRDMWATIARGEIWRGDFRNKAKDGSYYWVDTTIVPFLNESGKPYQYLSIRIDITERLNYIKAIEEQNKILNEISWVQSHMVRSPLARIMGLIPLIKDLKINDTEKKVALEYLLLSAQELDESIKSITKKTKEANYPFNSK